MGEREREREKERKWERERWGERSNLRWPRLKDTLSIHKPFVLTPGDFQVLKKDQEKFPGGTVG